MKILKLLFTALILFGIAMPSYAVQSDDDIRTIIIRGTDDMKFDVTLIEAEPGERIRITLETVSNMPAQVMAHNVAVVDLDVDIQEFVMASMTATDNEYIAPDYEENVIAFTRMIGGGEVDSVDFTVPDTPGDYEYVCTFPGHYFGGMRGILRVAN